MLMSIVILVSGKDALPQFSHELPFDFEIHIASNFSYPPFDFWWNASSSIGLVRLLVLYAVMLTQILLLPLYYTLRRKGGGEVTTKSELCILKEVFPIEALTNVDSKIKISDMIQNGVWVWPEEWVASYPNILSIPNPTLNNVVDKVYWVTKDGKKLLLLVNISTAQRLRLLEVNAAEKLQLLIS
ncbi:hypothetical protein Tco_0806930 [Tanacetum coccineum]